ncbi:MAG: dTDP-4-dehydrorhamnose reductase [Oscillospiraceae bacterium]|nr:dTDP-4-dehydrorhamnose reductase [Oscillospiraceae bacterium]MBP1552840.1 dTDP-4-dehydrorhamnose reductase [Oscillospiraceae bacterium]MBP1571511.1 dTDP-4-dehydrorhamnose reductase [Oscillospiraceae bacterium]
MKILITGSKGMLATQVINDLERGYTELGDVPAALKGAQLVLADVDELDITDKAATEAFIAQHKPDIVINCAAYTNVDGCESNQDTAFMVNAIGSRNLAIACENTGAKLVHVSTDYVFRGDEPTPRREYDMPWPISAYGKTKYAGEQFVRQYCKKSFIVRTAWLYGYNGKNFVKTMVWLAKEKGGAKVVNDQHGNPTNAADLSHHLLKIAASEEYGTYHCTGNGECTWFEFAAEIARLAGYEGVMSPCTSEEFPTPTKRPAYSSLDNMMLRVTVGDEMRHWKDALKAYFDNQK